MSLPSDPGAGEIAAARVRTVPNSSSSTDSSASFGMLRRIVSAACAVVHADGAAILLYDREMKVFVPTTPGVAAGLDERWLQRQGLCAAQELAMRAVRDAALLDVLDSSTIGDLDLPLLAGGVRPGAVCAILLAQGTELIGALEVYHAASREAPLDYAVLQPFAEMCGFALLTARRHDRERSLRSQLEALDAATTALATEMSPDVVLRRIIEIATMLVGARYGALGVAGTDHYLTEFITVGLSEDERTNLGQLPRGHGLLGVLINEGRVLRVPTIARDPRRVGFPPNHPHMASLLGVPIRMRDVVVGDIYLTDKIGEPDFSEDDQRLVELLAVHAGIAIENARLHAQEEQARHTLQVALESMRQQSTTLRQQAELISLAHDAIIVRDPESRVTQWNQGAETTYGWSSAEATGQVSHSLLQTVFPTSPADVESSVEQRGTWEGELEHTRRDGTRIIVESRQAVVRDAHGLLVSVLEINRDITARKRAEASVRFLAELSTALMGSLDVSATASTVAEHVSRELADWCGVLLLADIRTYYAALAQHGLALPTDQDPSVQDPPVRGATISGALTQCVQAARPLLAAETSEQDLEMLTASDLRLAVLRGQGAVSWMLVPLIAHGQTLGALSLIRTDREHRFGAEDLHVAQETAARTALAVANASLYGRLGELTQQRERERIGRDLHDGIIQDIYAAALRLEGVAEDAADLPVKNGLLRVTDQLTCVIGDIRTYIRGMRARELEGRQLSDGLACMVEEVSARSTIAVAWSLEGRAYTLPDAVANTLLLITREALSNVVKHAQAKRADVRLCYAADGVMLSIADDGRGFDVDTLHGAEHLGLRNLRDRAVEAGGRFAVTGALGSGTTIQVWIPSA